jgi:CMP-N-acetylneuraminate monooxygenase
MPNKWILPKVDLLFTPFASGASGFPSMIDNFSNSEKIKIIQSNRLSILNTHVKKLIAATNPKYVVPYAGYFTEAPRDDEVKKINIKNSPDDLISFVETEFSNIRGINPLTNSNISLYKDEIVLGSKNELPAYFIDEEYIDEEISNFSPKNPIITDEYLQRLGDQFLKSSFCENLTIVILPSSKNFDRVVSKALVIDFSKSNRMSYLMECENSNEEIINKIAPKFLNNIELLRIRDSSMIGAFSQGLPFEDLSIGFQVKMFRTPNIYNFSFWDHFTNKKFIQLPPPSSP